MTNPPENNFAIGGRVWADAEVTRAEDKTEENDK